MDSVNNIDDTIRSEDDCDSMKDRNILLKNYQIRLFEKAKERNSIIYLPTGAGKTLIAIHVLCSRAADVIRPINEGGKRAFFLANTKLMSIQLARVLQTHTKFKVTFFNGDMNVDSWSRNKWNVHFEINQVIVLTGEILSQILKMEFIKVSDITLIVFDECHHATADHPYSIILKYIAENNSVDKPLLLGLSSVLLNSSPKNEQVFQLIQSLENLFGGKIITDTDFEEIMSLATKPIEKVVTYKESNHLPCNDFFKLYDDVIDVLKNMCIKLANSSSIPKEGKDFKSRNRTKRIKNCFVLSKGHLQELGLFGASISALFFIILLEKYRLMSDNEKEIQLLIYARTEFNKIRHALLKVIGDEENSSAILKFSTFKVQQLINVLMCNNEKATGKHLSTIIFVHQRATAVILAFFLKRLSAIDERFSFIKADFVVGLSAVSNESVFLNCKNEEVVKQFSSQSLNVLVSTNMLEEGIDISNCNVVISFDFPLSYPSYFQSKGRARSKDSVYYVFIMEEELTKKKKLLEDFKKIGEMLMERICGESEDIDEEKSDEMEKLTFVGKTRVITVDGIIAIKTVNRYCSKLPQDKFSFLSPITWYIVDKINKEKKAFVQLPVNCPLREVIEGEWRESKKQAKRSVYLITLKKLYDIGELNDDLDINSFEVKEENFNDLFPHYKKENIDASLPQPGTKKRKQIYEMKFSEALSNCLASPGSKAYLHVIDLTVAFEKPSLQRKIAIYDILRLPVTFAIITSKKLTKILQFPLFLDMGQINCDFLVNYDEITLTESEMNDIKSCHFALFQKVTKVLKNSQVFDNRNKEHSFFVVPVKKNEEGRYVLSWDLINLDFCKNSNSALVAYNPSYQRKRMNHFDSNKCENSAIFQGMSNSLVLENRKFEFSQDINFKMPRFEFTETLYKYFVIMPNYRNVDPPQYYIVSKLCHDMSPLTPFPRADYSNYIHYYKDKYLVEITNTNQPLLKVSPLYNCSNFNKPKRRAPRRAREKYKEYEEHLIPELCDVIPFDKRYWVKALLLPTILNRIYHVYCVEEFRKKIISETGLGSFELSEGTDWKPLEVDETLADEEEEGITNTFSISSEKTSLPLSKLKVKTQTKNKVTLDAERHMYEIGLCDLEFYVKNLVRLDCDVEEEEELARLQKIQSLANDEIIKLATMRNIQIPILKVIKNTKSSLGPDLAQLIQTCTAKSANDIVDYERLETLGDSFLKFAVSLFLFKNYPENEGILSALKGKIVGNRNLLYCGLEKNIQDVINVTDFVPLSDWNPPLLCVPERLVDGIMSNNIDPAVLYRFYISFEEQFSGVLSESTYEANEEIIKNYDKCWEMSINSLLPYKLIGDKIISDCVEAFIGTYLLTFGFSGALEFLLWLGILPKSKGSYSSLIEEPYSVGLLTAGGDAVVMNLLSEVFYSDLEDILNYHFNNKALLLEALTHPSYTRNRITHCYQRLEFLGDAIIDFLITAYIYENCGHLTPGQVTDIRSSLVNNITFACLVVRYEIYKYLLSFSSNLCKAIEKFVSFQISRDHVVDDNVLILLEENDCIIGESIQVPKALGDLFESLAGAIFLDSGNSLETVWKIYYRLMKREIDEFTKTVPKTATRLLQEICGDTPYYETKVICGIVKVSCSVYFENQEIKGHGFGANKKEGKRSAAKLVLNKILTLKK